MTYSVKHVIDYLLLRGVIAVVRRLPYPVAMFVGWTIAWPMHHLLRFRVREARSRIREVFGDRFSSRDINRIAWLSWRNFAFTAIDLIRLPWVDLKWLDTHVTGAEEAKALLLPHRDTGKGAVIAVPHMGAWEVAGVAMQRFGIPIFFLTGKQKNPLTDAYINRLRQGTGITTIPRASNLLREVIRQLKKGGFLAFLPDVRSKTESLTIRFLGKEANVPAGMALFAYQADVPILSGIITRVGWTRHHITVLPPIWPDRTRDKREEWQRMTREVFVRIEAAIRAQPEQWFWYNKRWILDPITPDPAFHEDPLEPATP